MDTLTWKVIGASSALIAGLIATQILDRTWEHNGRSRVDPADPTAPLLAGLAYVAVSGMVAGISRALATRAAARAYLGVLARRQV